MEDFNKYTSHINYSPIVDFVLQQGKQTYYKKGDYFSRQGEVCKTMGFVSSGSFRYCCTNSAGENSIVGYTFDHSFVGNYPAFQLQDKSNVDIQALCDCSVYVINYQQMADFYDTNDDKNAEKILEDFAKNGTPHQYWLARGFILWADIYIRQGDDLQARAYLNNLKNNYKGDDEIAGMIEDRLGKLKQ